MIEEGKKVSIEYTVFLEDKTPVDTNVGKDPLVFTHGRQQILPALESELTGLSKGETKKVTLTPEKAYGPINPEAVKEVNPELIPEKLRYEGAILVIPDENEGDILIRVKEVLPDKVTLDFNHPLAGQTLTFDVKILEVA